MSFLSIRAGLDLLLGVLQERWQEPLTVSACETVPYPIYQTSNLKPLPCSAARLVAGQHAVWLPAPLEPPDPGQGLAPLYLHANQLLVMPTIRLWTGATDAGPEYVDLSGWLLDALQRWKFLPASSKGAAASTLLEQLPHRKSVEEGLRAVALLVRYALFGSDRSFVLAGLRLPTLPMWVRPVGATDFARQVARALVVTARLGEEEGAAKACVPTSNLRAESYRIHPCTSGDWGIDPVHTPEGNDIRLTGRLGVGVHVGADRRLQVPAAAGPPLSPSTARLPFAGYNDPRRLLMAANMQVHAVPLQGGGETPLVRQDSSGIDPCGTHLHVGYLAWQGWNHEDAWVLSESGARKLTAVLDHEQAIAIRSVEELPELLVHEGDAIQRGQLLLRRFAAPGLLCSSLEMLGKLDLHEGKITLAAEKEDTAPWAGEVLRIERHDLFQDATIPPALTGSYRCIYRLTLRRTLPLAVGDKLANRHGHKGVVGAILADEAMPRWRGQPLEALIDPISVLNRSNWGQVHETLAGAEAKFQERADEQGRSVVESPQDSDWMTQPVRAVAGVQFVLRMPHHACDKLSGSPLAPASIAPNMHRRHQRFGEMDQWALWAHALAAPGEGSGQFAPAVAKLGRLLATAGFGLKREADCFTVQALSLEDRPPQEAMAFPFQEGSPAEVYDALDALAAGALTVLVFEPPLQGVYLTEQEEFVDENDVTKSRSRKINLSWLPLLPLCDRPRSVRLDGAEEPHELTRALRWVMRALRKRAVGKPSPPAPLPEGEGGKEEAPLPEGEGGNSEADGELRYAVHTLMQSALALAVGLRATGQESSKMAFLRRGVLGRRLGHSARATATPAGPLSLALDEIGVPPALAWSLFGPGLPRDSEALAKAVDGRWVWLKRDPVLHRWGLLPVRVRVVAGETIRLPASLLGPLGADFDGDTVALFASLPGTSDTSASCRPPALAWHPLLERAMFLPGKQYLYGLYLLGKDAARLQQFQQALAHAGAPAWPAADQASAALQQWVRSASGPSAEGRWWALVEQHALAALSSDPGMGLGLADVATLAELDVVRCGAVKNLYQDPQDQEVMRRILAGKGLEIYQRENAHEEAATNDPIADVMVAAKASIGRFGGALRRLIYSARPPLQAATVAQAQALTEQVTQKALSVKAGKPPIYYGDYERQLRRLLRGEAWEVAEEPELRALLEPLSKVWEQLRLAMAEQPVAWLDWLRQPHELPNLLRAEKILRLPLNDLRLQGWLH